MKRTKRWNVDQIALAPLIVDLVDVRRSYSVEVGVMKLYNPMLCENLTQRVVRGRCRMKRRDLWNW